MTWQRQWTLIAVVVFAAGLDLAAILGLIAEWGKGAPGQHPIGQPSRRWPVLVALWLAACLLTGFVIGGMLAGAGASEV